MQFSNPRVARLIGVAALVGASTIGAAPAVATAAVVATPAVAHHHIYRLGLRAAPPTTADCQAQFQINCYSPNQIEKAYNTPSLYNKGITGRGRTIAVVDSFGSPTVAKDLHTFDRAFGLPDPPSIKTITPAGKLPPFDPKNSDMNGWAFETTLDAEYAHAMAPEANILVVATPVSETEGVQGFPEIVKAENYVINHKLADVISQSFGATENTFPSKKSLLDLRSAFKNAKSHHVTVLGSSGDAGATDAELDGTTDYPYRVTSWPDSDPLVTGVGGTQLNLDAKGNRITPDVVWNDGYGAGGGGKSIFFPRPAFQDRERKIVGDARGVPDISLSAAVDGGVIVYTSYDPSDVGYGIVGGTSEASPLFGGVVALADQYAHKKLGDLNGPLYKLSTQTRNGIVDVTSGNNSFDGVTGFSAKKGYDLASGLGTVNTKTFVPALADQAG
ncbi:S8 family serine peptidase [uncultured Jatrophihabitans sp.]|uniref:S53 family peptidase n=1 Tax=uncultured Jatrophihabitans sp. TaxID=1610747 RepID=UPI0035CB9298